MGKNVKGEEMSIISKWLDTGKEWLFKVALQKVIKRVIQVALAFLASGKLQDMGVQIDQEKLTIALYAGIEIARNYLKTKYGLKFL